MVLHPHEKVRVHLEAREAARRRGDTGIERAINADLDRWGYKEPPPPKRKQRTPRPKCEHNRDPERCVDCNDPTLDTSLNEV